TGRDTGAQSGCERTLLLGRLDMPTRAAHRGDAVGTCSMCERAAARESSPSMLACGLRAPAHLVARPPALPADLVRALGAEALGERGLALIAELDVGADQSLQRRGLAEIGRRRGEAGALLRDALEHDVHLAARTLLFDLAPHRHVRQRVGADGVAGDLEVQAPRELLPALLDLGHRRVVVAELARGDAALDVGLGTRCEAVERRLVGAHVTRRDPLGELLRARVVPHAAGLRNVLRLAIRPDGTFELCDARPQPDELCLLRLRPHHELLARGPGDVGRRADDSTVDDDLAA